MAKDSLLAEWIRFTAAFKYFFEKCQHISAELAPPFPLWETEKWLAQWADRSRSTMSTYAGWCSITNPSFWNREDMAVTAREVWGVCLPLLCTHLPYRVPYKPQKPAVTIPLPCAAEMHILLSVMSLIYKCPCYFPYFTWSTLHSQPALPWLFSGFVSHAADLWRHFPYSKQTTTENRTWEAKEGEQWQREVAVKQEREDPPSIWKPEGSNSSTVKTLSY